MYGLPWVAPAGTQRRNNAIPMLITHHWPPKTMSPQRHAPPGGNQKKTYIEGWAQDYSNSNIFLKPLFRGNLDPFVNNANLGAIAHTSNDTLIFIVYRKKCCNLHNAFMVRRLGLGKNNHLTYASLALNPRYAICADLLSDPTVLWSQEPFQMNI